MQKVKEFVWDGTLINWAKLRTIIVSTFGKLVLNMKVMRHFKGINYCARDKAYVLSSAPSAFIEACIKYSPLWLWSLTWVLHSDAAVDFLHYGWLPRWRQITRRGIQAHIYSRNPCGWVMNISWFHSRIFIFMSHLNLLLWIQKLTGGKAFCA